MKCPLVVSGNQIAQFVDQTKAGDCLQAECAWWFPVPQCCAVLMIACELSVINDEKRARLNKQA